MADQPTQRTTQPPAQDSAAGGAPDAQLIEEITRKVYALLLRDLKIERERRQLFRGRSRGGR